MAKPTIFAEEFNLTEKRAMELYASITMRIYKDGMCDNCGIHPAVNKAMPLLKDVEIHTKAEADYLHFIVGCIMYNPTIWRDLHAELGELDEAMPVEHYIDWAINDMKSQMDDLRAPLN